MEMMTALSSDIGIAVCSQVYTGGEHPGGLILSGHQRQMTPKTLPNHCVTSGVWHCVGATGGPADVLVPRSTPTAWQRWKRWALEGRARSQKKRNV